MIFFNQLAWNVQYFNEYCTNVFCSRASAFIKLKLYYAVAVAIPGHFHSKGLESKSCTTSIPLLRLVGFGDWLPATVLLPGNEYNDYFSVNHVTKQIINYIDILIDEI